MGLPRYASESLRRHVSGKGALRHVYQYAKCFSVLVQSDTSSSARPAPFRQRVKVGKHSFFADEPATLGGTNVGPSPYDLLLSSLGACTSMTLKMYADRKKMPLEGVDVELNHDKIYMKDCEACVDVTEDKANTLIDRFQRVITLHGDRLSSKDREDLLRIANRCPVHKTLESSSVVTTVLSPHEESQKLSNAIIIPPRTSTLPGNFPINRVLPFKEKRLVGPFCFLDHFGPIDVTDGSMDVGPHPHIGLSTLTYLYEGALIHRDSTGINMPIFPGDVNFMASGKGVVHSERGTEALELVQAKDGRKWLHGLQLWVALPAENEDCEPRFSHADKAELPALESVIDIEGEASVTLVAGSLLGKSVATIPEFWPMFMVDVDAQAGAKLSWPIEELNEVAIYVVNGRMKVGAEDTVLDAIEAAVYTSLPKRNVLCLEALEDSKVVVFGGMPFPEERYIVWNYVATSKAKIKAAVREWDGIVRGQKGVQRVRFGEVAGEDNKDSLPMPPFFNTKAK